MKEQDKKISDIVEIIGQSVFNYTEDDESELHSDIMELTGTFMDLAVNSYIAVQWPEVQELMEEDWFQEEAILDVNCIFGDSAYFIPIKYLI